MNSELEQKLIELSEELSPIRKLRKVRELCSEVDSSDSSAWLLLMVAALESTYKILKSQSRREIKNSPILDKELREIYKIAKEKRQDYMAKMLEEGRLDAMYGLPGKDSGVYYKLGYDGEKKRK